jgi:2-C-methyl-D-erythritol 4-phosphate cytidylyltransferase
MVVLVIARALSTSSDMPMKVCAIIPAAGQGTRMRAKVAKQYLLLDEKPVLDHTLQTFSKCGLIHSIILVVPAGDVEAMRSRYLQTEGKLDQVIAGGEKRQDSVYNGFNALDTDTEIVMVHDGVRPFVSIEIIENSITTAAEQGAVITAIPVNDTLKEVDSEHQVMRTVDREGLWRVQTPQAFQYNLLKLAFAKAYENSFYGTDEASLIEHMGDNVSVIPGSELNIKITRPEDLILAEGILSSRKNSL